MPVTKELEDVQAHVPKFLLDKVSTYLNFLLHLLWHCFSFLTSDSTLVSSYNDMKNVGVPSRKVAQCALRRCKFLPPLRQALKVCEWFPISEDVRQSCQGLPVFSFTLSFSHLSEDSHFSLWRCIQTCLRSVWFLFNRNSLRRLERLKHKRDSEANNRDRYVDPRRDHKLILLQKPSRK